MPPGVAEVVWISEATPGFHNQAIGRCDAKPVEGVNLPVALRGRAEPAESACGAEWRFVRFDDPLHGAQRAAAWLVPASALSVRAPKSPWDRKPATGTAWVNQTGERPTLAIPLDDPNWTSPALLSLGEPVERLAPQVVRTRSGHELWLDEYYLRDADPLTTATYASSEERVKNLRRLHEGRKAHEGVARLAPLPASDVLARAPVGQAFAFKFRPEWLSEPRYAPDWFEPVGHTLSHACERVRPFEPCGTYRLDYAPLGAWQPDQEVEVIGVWTGRALELQVVRPWSGRIGVTAEWVGAATR